MQTLEVGSDAGLKRRGAARQHECAEARPLHRSRAPGAFVRLARGATARRLPPTLAASRPPLALPPSPARTSAVQGRQWMPRKNGGSGPRAVALVGPYGSGKTTLLESILAITGAVQRKGSVPQGN